MVEIAVLVPTLLSAFTWPASLIPLCCVFAAVIVAVCLTSRCVFRMVSQVSVSLASPHMRTLNAAARLWGLIPLCCVFTAIIAAV